MRRQGRIKVYTNAVTTHIHTILSRSEPRQQQVRRDLSGMSVNGASPSIEDYAARIPG